MFGIFSGKQKRFIDEAQHKKNVASQLSMSPQTVEQLRGYGVTEDKLLRLEYFFYTDSPEKAEALNSQLSSLGYSSEFGTSAGDDRIQIVTGWSTPIAMATNSVLNWTEQMCKLGFEHDCEFDGWGTNPEQ